MAAGLAAFLLHPGVRVEPAAFWTIAAAAAGILVWTGWLFASRRERGEDLTLELTPLPQGGATIFAEGSGHLPGLRGRVDADRDTSDRTLLYSSKLTIDEGREQPVPFRLGKPLRLTDAFGTELWMTIIDIAGRSVLVEHRPCSADAGDGAE